MLLGKAPLIAMNPSSDSAGREVARNTTRNEYIE